VHIHIHINRDHHRAFKDSACSDRFETLSTHAEAMKMWMAKKAAGARNLKINEVKAASGKTFYRISWDDVNEFTWTEKQWHAVIKRQFPSAIFRPRPPYGIHALLPDGKLCGKYDTRRLIGTVEGPVAGIEGT
jgi:hypothetical protein